MRNLFGSRPAGYPTYDCKSSTLTDPAADPRIRKLDRPQERRCSSSPSNFGQHARTQHLQASISSDRAKCGAGAEAAAPTHFVAITDPGSAVERLARSEGFRSVHHGLSSIGGRYSVLSNFGMIPAVAIGVDPGATFSKRAAEMVRSCAATRGRLRTPGSSSARSLGICASVRGRDKLTPIIASPGSSIADFGAWLEQAPRRIDRENRPWHRPCRSRAPCVRRRSTR